MISLLQQKSKGDLTIFRADFLSKTHKINLRAADGTPQPPGLLFLFPSGIYFMPRLTISVTTKLATSSP